MFAREGRHARDARRPASAPPDDLRSRSAAISTRSAARMPTTPPSLLAAVRRFGAARGDAGALARRRLRLDRRRCIWRSADGVAPSPGGRSAWAAVWPLVVLLATSAALVARRARQSRATTCCASSSSPMTAVVVAAAATAARVSDAGRAAGDRHLRRGGRAAAAGHGGCRFSATAGLALRRLGAGRRADRRAAASRRLARARPRLSIREPRGPLGLSDAVPPVRRTPNRAHAGQISCGCNTHDRLRPVLFPIAAATMRESAIRQMGAVLAQARDIDLVRAGLPGRRLVSLAGVRRDRARVARRAPTARCCSTDRRAATGRCATPSSA